MKKRLLAMLLCCSAVFLLGCKQDKINTPSGTKYQRICFENQTLGEDLALITEDTAVRNDTTQSFPAQLPIYKIKEHTISEEEFHLMEDNLGITEWYWDGYNGREVNGLIAGYADPGRGYYYTLGLTDEELIALAWETFNKIPFLEGEYECVGVSSSTEMWSDAEEKYLPASMTVSFAPLLDGIRVVGNNRCDLTFDAAGLQGIHIVVYDYEEIGTMDVIPLANASSKIKSPDAFNVDIASDGSNIIKKLQVDRTKLLLVNQYSNGCTILQPIYNFTGTATMEDGAQAEFSSKVIAIPESYTYEAE